MLDVSLINHLGPFRLGFINELTNSRPQLEVNIYLKERVESLQNKIKFAPSKCRCSSGVERFLGKEEASGSNPDIGSNNSRGLAKANPFFYAYYRSYIEVISPFSSFNLKFLFSQ